MTVPDYYPSFACKCGECRNVCCKGWKIVISQTEYFQLLGRECSPELRRKLDAAFFMEEHPTPERYAAAIPNYEGKCRILNEEGLCALQKECGESAIPSVCRLYPRSIRRESNGRFSAVCSGSCEAVTEALMRAEPMKLISHEVAADDEEAVPIATADNGILHGILTNRKCDLARRILDAGRALNAEVTEIPMRDTISALIAFLEEFAHANESVSILLEAFGDKETLAERLPAMIADVKEKMPDAEAWLENILVNHMMYVCFPDGESAEARFTGLSALYGLMVMAIAIAPHDKIGFADMVAEGLRFAEHSPFYHNAEVLLAGKIGGIAEMKI